MVKECDLASLAPPLTEQEKHTQHHIQTEQQVIHLLLNELDAIKELRDNGFTTDHFEGNHRPLVQAIFDEFDSSNGTRLVTRENYKQRLFDHGLDKGNVYVTVQLHDRCYIGTDADKNDLGLLMKELREAFIARKSQHYLSDYGDNTRKLGYEKAHTILTDQLNKITSPNKQGDGMLHDYLASSKQFEATQWLWQDIIPSGKLTLFGGDAGSGKSLMSLYIAAHVSTGKPFPYTHGKPITKGKTIVITTEDDPLDTRIPRLVVANANRDNIVLIDPNGFNLDNYLSKLVELIDKHPTTRLVIFDPLSEYLGYKIDNNSPTEIRRILGPVNNMAQDRGIAVVGILHHNKTPPGVKAKHKIAGTHQYDAVARVVYAFLEDANSADRKMMSPTKASSSKLSPTIEFRIEEDTSLTDHKGEQVSTAKLIWDGLSDLTADEIIEAQSQKSGSKGQAIEWLTEFMAVDKTSKEVQNAAEHEGINYRTLKRAKQDIGFKAFKKGNVWYWPALSEANTNHSLEEEDQIGMVVEEEFDNKD